MGKTLTEQYQEISNKYMRSGKPWPATTEQIARWAIEKKLWAPQPQSLIKLCAEQLSEAMRVEYFTDPQGRKVRAKHAARVTERGKQLTLWADIRSATRGHMAIAFQQRRQQVLGECHQLKTDVDSYNQNGNPGKQIEMIFDFTMDLAEWDVADRTGIKI